MYLLFDIGGTNLRYAFSKDGLEIGEVSSMPTPRSYEEMLEVFKQAHREFSSKELRSVVVGIAGSQDREHTMVLRSRNLPQATEKPLKEDLMDIFNTQVFLANDAIVAGMGEALRGAGKGHPIVAYLTISTGVGGAKIVRGMPDANALGSEPGKQIIEQGKTLEQLVSGKDVQERYGDPKNIKDEKVWDELARFLAIGLNNSIVHWSPDIVVLGGSMILGEPAIPLENVQKHLKEILTIFPAPPPIKKAALGNAAGLYGALEFAKQHFPVLG